MTWLRELKPLHPGCTSDRDLKILRVYFKNQNSWSLKKMFSRIVLCHDHKRSTCNDLPGLLFSSVTHPQRYINKGGLLRQIYVQQLVASNFAKNQKNFKGEICFNVITPFTITVVVLQSRDVPKSVIWVNQNGGAQAVVRGSTFPLPPPPPPLRRHCNKLELNLTFSRS